MSDIFYDSGISPCGLSFLEAHGTGTAVGDPQEVKAVDWAIAKKREKPLLIGSVKSNKGAEGASGASTIKDAYPNIHLNKIKKGLEGFEQGRLKAVTEITDLEDEEAIIGINNLGFGGNNCHLVFRRFKKKKFKEEFPNHDLPRLICVSGRSEESVLALLNELNGKHTEAEYVALLHNVFKKNVPNHLYRGYTIIFKNGPIKTLVKCFSGQIFPLLVHFGQFNKHFKILGKYLLGFLVFKATMSRINKHLLPKNINIIDLIFQNEAKLKINFLGAVAL
ncbi:Ketoacyl-synt C domain containing protein [Asbolus verrucosus]|uniref:Ketoacyl-synt C domain containing protein n=1 Tax=Asbolus verrucosus TaxID=1661398 RepID=A0A482WC75_ASBVE|nr:Ketoacyl-synt C domain containing protein [Asbolus verrucosus]